MSWPVKIEDFKSSQKGRKGHAFLYAPKGRIKYWILGTFWPIKIEDFKSLQKAHTKTTYRLLVCAFIILCTFYEPFYLCAFKRCIGRMSLLYKSTILKEGEGSSFCFPMRLQGAHTRANKSSLPLYYELCS